jgi:hypothetical protein
MKLKGRRFEIVTSKGNRKRYSTELRESTSTELSKSGKNDGIAVYVLKGTILKEIFFSFGAEIEQSFQANRRPSLPGFTQIQIDTRAGLPCHLNTDTTETV